MESLLSTGRRRQPPAPATSFVGRADEVGRIIKQLQAPSTRLVSLIGPGGVGKTRLATHVYLELRPNYAGWGAFAPLWNVINPELVGEVIAQDLGFAGYTNGNSVDFLISRIGDQEVLLFADGLERVGDHLYLFSDLMAQCPNLKLLVTSRHRLNLAGEMTLQVSPLPTPAPGMSESQVRSAAAIELFVDRARAVDSSFTLDPENIADVADLCRRLDGIPLAIEMAAVQISLLPPHEIAQRIKQHSALPAPPPRDLAPRHRSLEAVMVASFELLTEEERQTLACITVFAGDFGSAAAAVLTVADDSSAGAENLTILGSLVNKSVLVREPSTNLAGGRREIRFSMLGTIRDYALLLLGDPETIERARTRHAAYYRSLSARLEPPHLGGFDENAFRVIERELPNLRVAIEYLSIVAPQEAAELAASLGWFWTASGLLGEGRVTLERFHGSVTSADSIAIQAKLKRGLGLIIFLQGDASAAEPYYREAARLYEQVGDIVRMCDAKSSLCSLQVYLDQVDNAESVAGELIAELQRLPVGDERNFISATVESDLGMVAYVRGDIEAATMRFLNAWNQLAGANNVFRIARYQRMYACALCDAGRIREGLDTLRAILVLPLVAKDILLLANTVRSIGCAPGQFHQAIQAARLVGAASAIDERAGVHVMYPAERMRVDRAVAAIRAVIGKTAFDHAFEDGKRLTADEAIQEALEFADNPAASREASSRRESAYRADEQLSPRELEVLRLLAQRLSNKEIASRLTITERTAKKHVGNILAKLDVANRADAVRRARELELL